MKEILDGIAAVITAIGGMMLGAAALITALRRSKDKDKGEK